MHGQGGHKGRGKHKHGKHGHGCACPHKLRKHPAKHHKSPLGRFSRGPVSRLTTHQHGGVSSQAMPLPERSVSGGIASVEPQRCKACGKCIKACPSGAIDMNPETAVVNKGLCVGCGACMDACPTAAVSLA